jgi:hypothetical protein
MLLQRRLFQIRQGLILQDGFQIKQTIVAKADAFMS